MYTKKQLSQLLLSESTCSVGSHMCQKAHYTLLELNLTIPLPALSQHDP